MSDEKTPENIPMITVPSTRFGDLEVPADSEILLPAGLIGFPAANKFILVEHKAPFSWFHSCDDPNLAFVVIDGSEFGQHYNWKPPLNDKDCDFKEEDEFAILLIVTVRSDPTLTTVNLKAPLFVNIRNRRGVQVIFDDARYSTRHPLWTEDKDKKDETKKEEPKKD
jgi:flagellar assembly factor FliW